MMIPSVSFIYAWPILFKCNHTSAFIPLTPYHHLDKQVHPCREGDKHTPKYYSCPHIIHVKFFLISKVANIYKAITVTTVLNAASAIPVVVSNMITISNLLRLSLGFIVRTTN